MASTGTAAGATRRSAWFVAWVRAWRAGFIPYDDVLDEIGAAEDQMFAEGTDSVEVPLREALARLSPLHPDEIRLVLPAAGDPRGLPGPDTPFTTAALLAGEGVLAGGIGLVPDVRTHVSGSGDAFVTVVWRAYPLPAAGAGDPAPGPTPAEAEAELSEALAQATAQLTHLDIARWRPELAGALAALRRRDDAGDLPPVFDPRARRLYARASLLDRVLTLAEGAAPGGAVNAFEARQREAALRPLTTACRRALVAACNAPLA